MNIDEITRELKQEESILMSARVPQTYHEFMIKHKISFTKLMRKAIEELMNQKVLGKKKSK